MRVVHIITDLDTGGAEMMLYKLLSEQCANREIESFVVSLMGHGPITERIENIQSYGEEDSQVRAFR